MERPIRTPEGALVARVALYGDDDGVAVPFAGLGSSVGDNLTADPPLTVTPDGDQATISIATDAPNGVPTLDVNGLVRMAQMPIAGLNYHGNWDASTNTPTLANGTGTAGDFYRVSVAGTRDLGAGNVVFDVGDHVIYEGSVWQQFDPPQTVSWGDLTGTLADQTDLQTAVDAKADESDLTAHTGNTNNPHATTKAQLGLGSVDNTSDAAKPISTATQAALTAKADATALTAHTGNTSNPHGVTKTQVGLANVTNDAQVKAADKASQADAEAGIDGTKWMTPLATAEAIGVHAAPVAPVQSVAGKTGVVTLVKGDVGLANVDNTADTAKPVSTAQQAALDAKLTTPTPLIPKVVLGTTLETNVLGMVGYGQDVLGDTLVMRQLGGQISTATPQAATDATTKAYVDTAVAGAGGGGSTQLGTPATQTAETVNLSPTSATVQLLDCTSGDMMVNLPDAGDSTPAGTRFILKRVNAGGNGIDIDAGEANIDGVPSQGMASQYSYKDVVFDGTNWWIISSGGT
jgi:hypothetical protein